MEVFAYALFDQKASTLPLIWSISFQPSNGSYLEEYIPLAPLCGGPRPTGPRTKDGTVPNQ